MAHLHSASSVLRDRFVKQDIFPFSIARRALMSRENGFSLNAKYIQITKAFSFSTYKTKISPFPLPFPLPRNEHTLTKAQSQPGLRPVCSAFLPDGPQREEIAPSFL